MKIKLFVLILACLGVNLYALDNEILGFNIGGHSFQVPRSALSSLESPLLNNPEQSEHFLTRDNHGYAYILLMSEEGKLIEYFMHYKILPENYDIFIARQAAEHFGVKQMQTWINNNPPKRRAVRMWNTTNLGNSCRHCDVRFYRNYSNTIFEVSAHLVSAHGADIHGTFFEPAPNGDERDNRIYVQYSLP
jgi:hypothetical protein